MSQTTALIVDDEPLARRRLRDLIGSVDWIHCLGEAADGPAAVAAIDGLKPDLAFLDVRLPGISGIDLLRRVRHRPAVIFTTAYDTYAVTAFELAAIDYLLKPFGRERFRRAIERARPALESRDGERASDRAQDALTPGFARRLFVRDRGRVVPVPASSIERLEACDDHVRVYAAGAAYRIHAPLQEIERRLDPAAFVRVHRSHVVNLDHVIAWAPYDGSRFQVALRDGSSIVASRQHSQALRRLAR